MWLRSRKFLFLHGVALAIIGALATVNSVVGFRYALGPFSFLSKSEITAVGFIEAYGLACLLGISLILSAMKFYARLWHLFAASIHIFLFTINIYFWHLYEPLGLSGVGRGATIIHFIFFSCEFYFYFKCRLILHE